MDQGKGLKLVLALLAASVLAAPALAVPHCTWINSGNCNIACLEQRGSECSYFWVGACDDDSAPYAFVCETGAPITGYCSDCGSSGGPSGCFLAGTMITMADGSAKAIELIEAGDVVLAYDEESGELKPDAVRTIHEPATWDHYLVVNDRLRLTPVHPVLSGDEWVEIGDLKIGDLLTAADGTSVEVETIRRVDEQVTVYNFEVNPFGTYIANGIIVHNKRPPANAASQDLP